MAKPSSSSSKRAQVDPFARLQELLLKDGEGLNLDIQKELDQIRKNVEDPNEIERRIRPFLKNNIEFLKENFPEMFGDIITSTISDQIKNSQDQMVDALYPIIGKLIKKYIVKEFEALSEKIDQKLKSTFSWKRWKDRMKAWFSGVSVEDQVISSLLEAKIEDVFILEGDSGLILASYTSTNVVDEDMVGGMLSAIRAWGQDSFHTKMESLEMIEFGTKKIFLHNFHTYYIAVVVGGKVTTAYKNKLSNHLDNFANNTKPSSINLQSDENSSWLSEKLKTSIDDFQKNLQK